MSRASRAWAGWVALWSDRETADSLALFRILMGLTLMGTWAGVLHSGAASEVMVAAAHGGLAPAGRGPAWFQALGGATETGAPALLMVAFALSAALTLGVGGRWTALLLGQVSLAVFHLHPGTGGGHDRLITNALWLLVLSEAHTSWSLPHKLRTGSWRNPALVPAWPRQLLVYQLVLMYTLTGIDKQGPAWGPAEDYRALYYTFLLPSWARGDMTWIASVFPLTQLAGAIAWWWEALWFVLGLNLVARRARPASPAPLRWLGSVDLRPPFVALGVITHGSLWWFMNLGPFTPVTLAYYVCLYTPEELRGFWGAVIARTRFAAEAGEGEVSG